MTLGSPQALRTLQSFAPKKLTPSVEHKDSVARAVPSPGRLNGYLELGSFDLVQNVGADGAPHRFQPFLVTFASLLPNPGSQKLSETGACFCVWMSGRGKRVLSVCELTSKGLKMELRSCNFKDEPVLKINIILNP